MVDKVEVEEEDIGMVPSSTLTIRATCLRLPITIPRPRPLPLPRLLRRTIAATRCSFASASAASSSSSGGATPSDSGGVKHPWLIVGLGNPGKTFEATRHNVGFEMIDAIAQSEGIMLSKVQHKALIGKGLIAGTQVILAKPQTYVNLSGESVGPLATYFRIPIQQVLIIFDDMDLDFALMRLLPKGGHGGHNGMKSVIQHLKSREFPRLRIGIGRPPGKMNPKSFVLHKFNKAEREELDISIARGVDAMKLLASQGLEKTISTWNQGRKSKQKANEPQSQGANSMK